MAECVEVHDIPGFRRFVCDGIEITFDTLNVRPESVLSAIADLLSEKSDEPADVLEVMALISPFLQVNSLFGGEAVETVRIVGRCGWTVGYISDGRLLFSGSCCSRKGFLSCESESVRLSNVSLSAPALAQVILRVLSVLASEARVSE